MRKIPKMVSIAKGLILATWVVIAAVQSSTAQTSQLPEKPVSHGESVAVNSDELEATREQFFKLLRINPKLATIVVRDPTLLAEEQYVSRNNPALEQFLKTHPEIVRSPEFYLFANLGNGPRLDRKLRLEEAVGPELDQRRSLPAFEVIAPIVALLVFVCVLLALLWLVRMLVENRRWTRIFNRQAEAQNRVLEKFGSSEEMLNYMRSDSGKHLFEFAPAPLGPLLQSGSPISRILTPLQFGVVLTFVGIGFLILKSALASSGQVWSSDAQGPPLVLGVVTATLGVGLIVSAGISWAFARHLGMLPPRAERQGHGREADSWKSQ